MRILFALHYPLDPNAGAAGYTLRLAEALRQDGNDVEVVGATELFARVGKRPAELAFPFVATIKAQQALRGGGFDVVDASTGDLWPCPASLLRNTRGITVTRSHGLEHVESQALLASVARGQMTVRRRYHVYYGGVHLWQVARSLRVVDGAFFCNGSNRDFAVEHLGVDAARAFFVRPGVADHFLGLEPPSPSSSIDPRLAVIGPYAWVKGADVAALSLSRVLREWPRATLTWFGAREGEVLAEFDADVRGQVRVVPRYANPDLPNLLRGHHILVALSRAEGFPGAVLEGMACGLTVVASDIPGPRDILVQSTAGVLVPADDPDRVVKEVGTLLQDRARLDSQRLEAHRIAQGYRWRDVAAENLDIYERLLERKLAKRTR